MNKQEKQLDIYRSEYISKLETELEGLKRDVKDFTKLLQIYFDKYGGEIKSPLFEKLSKVGEN